MTCCGIAQAAHQIRLQPGVKVAERKRCEVGTVEMPAFVGQKAPRAAAGALADHCFAQMTADMPRLDLEELLR